MNTDELNLLTEKIIGCASRVHNTLGSGFLEKVYDNALAHELRKNGLHTDQQVHLAVWYDDVRVGEFIADQVVERTVLLEIKANSRGTDETPPRQSIT